MPDDANARLRSIPAVGELLSTSMACEFVARFGAGLVKRELRAVLESVREQIRNDADAETPGDEKLVAALESRLVRLASPAGRRAINGTGIILHTGLGRSPLCKDALDALAGCGGYTILQTSIDTGARSQRDARVEGLLRDLTGCEAATVVNNNAAATMLILNTVAPGREVVISRGQLVEIGGAFRLPDVMVRSGCLLKEVGTTNRTHVLDYENAIGEMTGAVMHAHTSNYRIRGFAGTPGVLELAQVCRDRGVLLLDDMGSGALVPLSTYGVPDEPMVAESISAGADLVCFSADKLICGPQGGIICGRRELVDQVRKNPFARMFRADKLTIAALEATLLHFINGTYETALPFYSMISRTSDDLRRQGDRVVEALGEIENVAAEVVDCLSYVGSGSAPDEGVPSKAVRLRMGSVKPNRLAAHLRSGIPSVFARVENDAVYLDMRTVWDRDVSDLCGRLRDEVQAK